MSHCVTQTVQPSADKTFSLSAASWTVRVVLVYILLSYWGHIYTYSRGLCFQYTNRKQTISREEAGLLGLPISSQYGRHPTAFQWLAGNICFCCSKKLFVCLNNYALMFLISFLKSPQKSLSSFRSSKVLNFLKLNTAVCWKLVYTSSYSQLTFDISGLSYRRKLAAYLYLPGETCLRRKASQCRLGHLSVREGDRRNGEGVGGGGCTERNMCYVVEILTVRAQSR